MYNHAPDHYICPFCQVAQGIENQFIHTKQSDIVYQDEYITAFINAGFFENNKGNVIIIPNDHYENIYDLPDDISAKIHKLEREVAIALKEVYQCDGVSSRQHNEPYGNQEVWHYHLHVFPRYKDDNLYSSGRMYSKPEERIKYADGLKEYFRNNYPLNER
ncbi:HIT family protein [Lacrimispora sp.]|uniref:HIT family protein n=1 Tax=Lacrimispora sp. TaxID=2719234 RepID=UPI0028A9EC5A|nr:HIT family protein [Lacrimispora sp.]